MVNIDLGGYDEIEKYIFNDVDKKIIKFLAGELERADKEGLINWNEFVKYCEEFGMIDPPNILTIPIPVLHRCLDEAKKRFKSKDGINKL